MALRTWCWQSERNFIHSSVLALAGETPTYSGHFRSRLRYIQVRNHQPTPVSKNPKVGDRQPTPVRENPRTLQRRAGKKSNNSGRSANHPSIAQIGDYLSIFRMQFDTQLDEVCSLMQTTLRVPTSDLLCWVWFWHFSTWCQRSILANGLVAAGFLRLGPWICFWLNIDFVPFLRNSERRFLLRLHAACYYRLASILATCAVKMSFFISCLQGENRAHKTHVCPDRALLGLICFTWGGGGITTSMKLAHTVDAKPVCVVVALARMVDATPVCVVVALACRCYACVCVCHYCTCTQG